MGDKNQGTLEENYKQYVKHKEIKPSKTKKREKRQLYSKTVSYENGDMCSL